MTLTKATYSMISGAAFNVRDYGAVGDGVANDKAAIQAAINAAQLAGGGEIYFPLGTYLIDGAGTPLDGLVITGSNITLRGSGKASVLKQSNTNQIMVAVDGRAAKVENLTVENLYFDGPTARHVMTSGTDTKQFVHLLAMVNVNNVTINNNVFYAFQGDGCEIDQAFVWEGPPPYAQARHNSNVFITNNVFDGFDNNNRNGISVIDGDNIVIVGNSFNNIAKQYMPGSVDIEPNSYPYYILRNITVSNNTFQNCQGQNGHLGYYIPNNSWPISSPPHNFVFSNNTFTGEGTGIFGAGDHTIAIGVTVSGNSYSGLSAPVLFGYKRTNGTFDGLVITGNSFDWSNGSTPIVGFKWVDGPNTYEDTVKNLIFSNNYIKGRANAGTTIGGSVIGAVVQGNTFDTALDYGVRFGAGGFTTMSDIMVSDNLFKNISGAFYSVFCGQDNPDAGSCVIMDNQHAGVAEPMNFVAMQAGKSIGYGTSAPTFGFHSIGARCFNSNPVVGQPKSWVCTVSGVWAGTKQGTWVSEGNL